MTNQNLNSIAETIAEMWKQVHVYHDKITFFLQSFHKKLMFHQVFTLLKFKMGRPSKNPIKWAFPTNTSYLRYVHAHITHNNEYAYQVSTLLIILACSVKVPIKLLLLFCTRNLLKSKNKIKFYVS